MADNTRGRAARNTIGLVLYLAGGWRSYEDINREFGWSMAVYRNRSGMHKTARRNVAALEQAGLPLEWLEDCRPRRVRLPADWIARTPWLRRYIIRKQPLSQPAYRRSLPK